MPGIDALKLTKSFLNIENAAAKAIVGRSSVKDAPKRQQRSCKQKMAKSSNNLVNPNARDAMDRFKMEAASHLDVPERY